MATEDDGGRSPKRQMLARVTTDDEESHSDWTWLKGDSDSEEDPEDNSNDPELDIINNRLWLPVTQTNFAIPAYTNARDLVEGADISDDEIAPIEIKADGDDMEPLLPGEPFSHRDD